MVSAVTCGILDVLTGDLVRAECDAKVTQVFDVSGFADEQPRVRRPKVEAKDTAVSKTARAKSRGRTSVKVGIEVRRKDVQCPPSKPSGAEPALCQCFGGRVVVGEVIPALFVL